MKWSFQRWHECSILIRSRLLIGRLYRHGRRIGKKCRRAGITRPVWIDLELLAFIPLWEGEDIGSTEEGLLQMILQ